MEEIVSWNGHAINDGTNYSAVLLSRPLLHDVQAQTVERNDARPVISNISYGPVRFNIEIAIDGTDTETLRKQLAQWFNPRDKQVKALVIEDDDGGRDRYLMCLCLSLKPTPSSNRLKWIAVLELDGFGDPDGRWRKTTMSSDTWNITASGQTKSISNDGHDIAYPVFTIEPTAAKTGGYAYKRWVSVIWNLDVTVNNYPTDITDGGFDTATLVSGGKMQADGDDLRVYVNGSEVDRWLYGMNGATTKVWANLNHQPRAVAEVETGFNSGDTVLTIDVTKGSLESTLEENWFELFPSSGILLIGSEAFTYTGKNASLFRFTGVRRAQRGTTAATHAAGATVHWIQNDIYILYGNSSVSAPVVDADYEPMIALNSTNYSWVYTNFYDESYSTRPGRWASAGSATFFYGGNHGNAFTNPYEELGIHRAFGVSDASIWYTFNPCGITNAWFNNGEKWALESSWVAGVDSSPDGSTWAEEFSISAPSVDSTWQSWSQAEALNANSIYVRLRFQSIFSVTGYGFLECADVTLTLNSLYIPEAALGAEQGNYQLDCTLTNNTNGHAIQVTYIMAANQEFEVNTDGKTLTDLEDGSGQFQALTLIGDPRRDWIPLEVGTNEFQYDDTGTNGVTVTVGWYERYFD